MIAITDGTADFTYHPEVQGVVELLINPQNSDCTKSAGTAYSFVQMQIGCELGTSESEGYFSGGMPNGGRQS